MITPIEIWSGGQTGVDRRALDFALTRSLPHSGWCPHGPSVIPVRYRLQETATDASARWQA